MRWIIGDVHGMLAPLQTLLAAIRQRDADAQLYFCGDYVDRGRDSAGVIDALLELQATGRAHFVRGNHDDMFDLLCNGRCFSLGSRPGEPADAATLVGTYEVFLREGLVETLDSYGVPASEALQLGAGGATAKDVRDLFSTVPEAHKQFIRDLPGVVETDDFFVCHAQWPPDAPDAPDRMNELLVADPHLRHDALWGRYVANQLRAPKRWRRPGYFGHTPTDLYLDHDDLLPQAGLPIFANGLRLIDTGAFSPGGILTAVCHDDQSILQAHRTGELL